MADKNYFNLKSKLNTITLIHWDSLSKLGKHKLFKSSYYWILLIPIAVKLLEKIDSPITFILAKTSLVFNLTLPFSWKVFYIGALFVTLANIIYVCFCPEIIKKFANFSDYKTQGYTFSYLLKFRNSVDALWDTKLTRLQLLFQTGHTDELKAKEIIETPEIFWEIFKNEKIKLLFPRVICGLSYLLGLILIVIILVQNILFVFEAIF